MLSYWQRFAINNGYRHIDCAKIYLNEKEVGDVFQEMIGKDVQRDELFIVGKVIPNAMQIICINTQ
jgi:alcohol dehydrogenase (NADP+)